MQILSVIELLMNRSSNGAQNKPIASVIAGSAQAISATVVGYPFDRVKAICQVEKCNSITASRLILVDQGLAGFYRGVIAPLCSHLVKRPMQFTLSETAKRKFPDSGPWFNYIMGMATGALGGAVATPFQVVKVGMQTSQHGNTWDYIKHVWRQNRRVLDFWKNWQVCAMKDMMFGSAFVGTYYTLRDTTQAYPQLNPTLMGGLNGALAHAVSWAVLIPIDYVKTQTLKARNVGKTVKPWSIITETIGQHGLRQSLPIFWKGVGPACARTLPVSFVALATFEWVREMF